MRIAGRNSLAYRMTLTGLLAIGMALATLTAALLVFDNISSRALLQSRLSTLADIVGQNSTAALNFNDPPAALEMLDALRAEPPVVSACLYESSGNCSHNISVGTRLGIALPFLPRFPLPIANTLVSIVL